ncbi:MAG: hypothetical protein SVU32_03625, partial [Candidatus Nanohaloarchaea archaeon]|nr:hypothetical protein [Candidatus Nanohaloarchaea archaeon]
ERFEESFQSRLGFEYVNLSIDRSGSPTNVFASQSGSAAAFISSYFYANDLFIPRQLFRDAGTYLTTNITIRGERYRVNTTGNGWIMVGETLNAAENYSVGQTLEAEGNLFRVASTYPLNLTAQAPYRFRNYLNATMIGGQPVLELRDWSWNVSEVAGESYNVSTSLGGGRYEGIPSTDCADPYRNASFTLGNPSLDLEVVLSDVDASCDDAYEYVNFDFNGNKTFNDVDDATGPGFGAEGIYQTRQTLTMDNRTFQLFVGPEGRWIYLRRIPPDTVPTMLWKTQAYKGNGNVFYMGGRRFGDDGLMLLRAAIARAAMERYRLGEQKIPGSPSVGVSIPDAISGEVYSSYTVDSVWWFQ